MAPPDFHKSDTEAEKRWIPESQLKIHQSFREKAPAASRKGFSFDFSITQFVTKVL